jgi:hypothetical protein
MSRVAAPAVTLEAAEDFQGLPARSLSNGRLRADVLAFAGPRVVRLFLDGIAGTLLAAMPRMTTPTPWGDYAFRGGHRLWHAPEVFPRTYVPDDAGVVLEETAGGLRLTGTVEEPTGIRKSLELALDTDEAALTLTHTLTNAGSWPVELAPWAITQLPLGGSALVPMSAPQLTEFTPNRSLVLWPYTRFDDPRLERLAEGVRVNGVAAPPLKIGTFVHAGWAAYLRDGVLFVKRFTPRPGEAHADLGCNVEIYSADAFLELETLGPLERLSPGESSTHVERWELWSGVRGAPSFEEMAPHLRR